MSPERAHCPYLLQGIMISCTGSLFRHSTHSSNSWLQPFGCRIDTKIYICWLELKFVIVKVFQLHSVVRCSITQYTICSRTDLCLWRTDQKAYAGTLISAVNECHVHSGKVCDCLSYGLVLYHHCWYCSHFMFLIRRASVCGVETFSVLNTLKCCSIS